MTHVPGLNADRFFEARLDSRGPRRVAAFGVGPPIDLAPGAEKQPLARKLVEHIRTNVVRDARSRAAFESLRGAVALIADDRGTALTLRFDFGRLVVHTGVVGVPDVTIRAATELLESLGSVRRRGLLSLGWGVLSGRVVDTAFGFAAGARELKIYGLATHPLLVRRLMTVLSSED